MADQSSPDYQLDEYRLGKLGGMAMDYQLAQIAADHPGLTPQQVRMVQQGSLKVAPSDRLVQGYGLPARYRITGADPLTLPNYSPSNSRFKIPANTLQDSIVRQDHAAYLSRKNALSRLMDKLDPKDPDDADRIETIQQQIDGLDEQYGSAGKITPVIPQNPIPLGKGTAGEVAPVYTPGGPASYRKLSNGGSVYFGPAAGAPAFRVGAPQASAVPAATSAVPVAAPAIAAPSPTTAAPYIPKWSMAKMLLSGGSPAGIAAAAEDLPNDVQIPANPPPSFKITPRQVAKRVAIAKQLTALGPDAPDEFKNAINDQLAAFDASVTNPPALNIGQPAPFRIAPQTAIDAASAALPDSGVPATSPRIRVVSADGKPGTIPQEQLEEALKSGYKRAE